MKNNILPNLIFGCLLINMFIPDICNGETESKNVTVGIIDSKYYYPPSRIYKVIIPVDEHFGGKIDDHENSISFTDDLCHLYRIEFTPISTEGLTDLEEIGREQYLKGTFEKWYMPLTIWDSIKEATIDYQKYLGELFEGSYYAEVYIPKGATCSVSTNGGPLIKADGRRGILTFIFGDYVYFVSVGFVAEEDHSLKKKEEIRKNIKDAAIAFAQTLQFQVDNNIAKKSLQGQVFDYNVALKEVGLTTQDVQRITIYYYKYPQPDKLLALLKVNLADPIYCSNYEYFHPRTFHFYATVARNDKTVLSKIQEMQSYYLGKQKKIIQNIIKEAENFKSPNADSPDSLSSLNEEFEATGDSGIVRKILDVYNNVPKFVNLPRHSWNKSETQKLFDAAGEVLKTLIDNGHKGVYDIVQAEFQSATGLKKSELGKIFEVINLDKQREDKIMKGIN
jgi:hypothetical protein